MDADHPLNGVLIPCRNTLYYYQKVTALSVANTSNWLLTNFPNLYLFGSLVAAEAYLGTDPGVSGAVAHV